ncbi:ankyrin repeat domain-containing protein 13C isoform X2 [Camellia sinensis]|uniref:ankyrin repeat domain-containing protein 13C isoform X2 n=1 Tax=Camellia sinensis TaxID=4442 RepID=UPI001035CDCA|nr:ankyrin repeat domain-containing protein 13C isoform X2 [Camellia sinensis]
MSKSSTATTMSTSAIKPEVYKHSPVHYAVALGDHTTLSRIVSSLPRLADPTQIHTESDSLAQERVSDQISAVLDRRDNPHRETPLHLAVRLNDVFAARTLAGSGADISLQNAAGWNALQEAMCRRCSDVAVVLLQYQHRAAWSKWRRRLPRLIAVLRRMRDFYMEISFHFESSIVPFVGKIAPSDTYKIWKRDGNLRADTSLAGFDGMKVQRADQSFLFLGDGEPSLDIPSGSLLVLNHDDRRTFDAFENAEAPLSDSDIAGFCAQTSVYRPGMDVTNAELVGRTNWRRQEKTESVGEWKARVYEVHNVLFSYRSRKIVNGDSDIAGCEQVLPLELEEDAEEGFLVAENPQFAFSSDNRRRHSSFVREDRDFVPMSRKSVDVPSLAMPNRRKPPSAAATAVVPPQTKEKEYVKSLRPSIWLTEQFPLKKEELLPLLDILANKVKAVRRMRELLTTKFPPATFPVKVAIPVVPTVRVVITFTKFVELQSTEQFYTPLSSPRHFGYGRGGSEEEPESNYSSFSSTSRSSTSTASAWLRRSTSRSSSASKPPLPPLIQQNCMVVPPQSDPFAIPNGYTWSSFDDKSRKMMKKSKSIRKSR